MGDNFSSTAKILPSLRRSGRKRRSVKELNTDYDYETFDNFEKNMKSSCDNLVNNNNNDNITLNKNLKRINSSFINKNEISFPQITSIKMDLTTMEAPDIIEAHLRVLEKRLEFVQSFQYHSKSPMAKLDAAAEARAQASDDVTVHRIVDKMLKAVCALHK